MCDYFSIKQTTSHFREFTIKDESICWPCSQCDCSKEADWSTESCHDVCCNPSAATIEISHGGQTQQRVSPSIADHPTETTANSYEDNSFFFLSATLAATLIILIFIVVYVLRKTFCAFCRKGESVKKANV